MRKLKGIEKERKEGEAGGRERERGDGERRKEKEEREWNHSSVLGILTSEVSGQLASSYNRSE